MGTKVHSFEITAICPECGNKHPVQVNITLPDNLVNNMLSGNCKPLDIKKVENVAKKAVVV
jgi:hypothetical protein